MPSHDSVVTAATWSVVTKDKKFVSSLYKNLGGDKEVKLSLTKCIKHPNYLYCTPHRIPTLLKL
jgi:hypothetical protein